MITPAIILDQRFTLYFSIRDNRNMAIGIYINIEKLNKNPWVNSMPPEVPVATRDFITLGSNAVKRSQ